MRLPTPRSLTLLIANLATAAALLCPAAAWGWGNDGHEIVAIIAADNLTPAAQSHVASILHVPADRITRAMARAAVLPDTEFREEDRRTAPWHFIDICLQDQRIDVPARCPGGNCVTHKIDEYADRLRHADYDQWAADGDLAFLIHFVGDLHQPLHAANDADKGANCVKVDSQRPENLHAVWDETIVRRLEERIDSGNPEVTARNLERQYADERTADSWIPADDIAWESNQLARSEIYRPLQLPVEPCGTADFVCYNQPEVHLSPEYLDHSAEVAGHQLAKAGFRLASLLNQIWTQPIAPDADHAAGVIPSTADADSPATESTGPFVGNRRSLIYAWPGCGSYDTMGPHNRVVFASREAAEQAGYRAAANCPAASR